METVILVVLAVGAILAANALGRWTRVGPPLLLVALGMAVSLAPFVPAVEVDPEWVLGGILPPLLYSSAIRTPLIDLKRNLGAISVFSVVLVIATAVITGFAVHLVFPTVPLNVAIALGAIVSPTDAAATAIIREAGAPPHVVTLLSGESLLNDPTALVMLRTALAATVSFPVVAWNFAWAIGAASAVGAVVGWLALRVGRRIQDPTLHTVFSFLVPFAAYLPVEHLGSSGLVAVVVAGLIVGQGAPRFVSARNRLAQATNWETVDMLAEGAVFGAMGLQVFGLYQGFQGENDSVGRALATAAVALAAVLAVRGLCTLATLGWLGRRKRQDHVRRYRGSRQPTESPGGTEPPGQTHANAAATDGAPATAKLGRRSDPPFRGNAEPPGHTLADASAEDGGPPPAKPAPGGQRAGYPSGGPFPAPGRLGWREGAVLEWAGLRGVVTLAAAQTLPLDTPERPALILIAFVVACVSLVLQGGTLPALLKALRLRGEDPAQTEAWRIALRHRLADAATQFFDADRPPPRQASGAPYTPRAVELARQTLRWVTVPNVDEPPAPGSAPTQERERREELRELRLAAIRTMRADLTKARREGSFPSAIVEEGLAELDREELAVDV
ncbi:MAG: sodium:proton antiporter [Bifidobacteriaceae bacterium]|jgi:CPA1 family monovalent cation:H+ antiporter|nr:sodium:proton antiporter [Bifidobacteriaceae bacterium]